MERTLEVSQAGGQEHRASSGIHFTVCLHVLCLSMFGGFFLVILLLSVSISFCENDRRSRFLDKGHQHGLDGGLEFMWVWFLLCGWFWSLRCHQKINTNVLKVG